MNDPVTPKADRPLQATFAGVMLFALWALTRSWDAPILDRYEFRQLQTALGTWWLVREGWQLNYLLPLFGPPWSVPMEFPTYQVLVATVHGLSDLPLEQAGRLTAILMWLACLPAVYDLLAVARLAPSRRLIVLMLAASSPVYLFYARTFMIETTALCAAVWFLALYRRALAEPRQPAWIGAATILAALAALTKVTTFAVFGVPAALLALAAWRQHRQSPAPVGMVRLGFAATIPVLVATGLAWWWVRHGDAVKDSNPFTGFLTARELRDWNFGPWSLRLDSSFWWRAQETLTGHILSEGALLLAVAAGCFAGRRARRVALAAAAGFAAGPLVFANLYHMHDYYYAANAILLVGGAGVLLAAAWDDPRLPRGTNWLLLGLMLATQAQAYYRGYHSHHRHPPAAPPALAETVRTTVPADGVVLIYGADWNPLLPYYFQRRALMVPGERENETAVLEEILWRLPPAKIAAMVVHGEKIRGRTDFIAERTARFGLSPLPAARGTHEDLYLPADGQKAMPAGPPPLSFPADLAAETLQATAGALFTPAPHAVRSRYGTSLAELAGRPVLNAHAPAEFHFRTPPGAQALHVVAGLAEAAYAGGDDSISDGITLEAVAVTGGGPVQLHYRRLDPANIPADRGPQTLAAPLPPGFDGEIIFRIGTAGNPTKDWAYVAEIRIH